ncbi:MAG: hypothetical protein JXM72_10090 [Deltaproteobacteria bacterium]|nr:hypothetical protein [Deltaproteobacteria bacterium]
MKRLNLPALAALCMIVFLCSCENIDLNRISAGPEENVTSFDPLTMEPTITQAIYAVEMAKSNELSLLPYVSVGKSAEIAVLEHPQESVFTPRKQMITNYSKTPDGMVNLEFFSESEDQYGRRDITVNKVIYSIRMPNKKEFEAIRQWSLKTGDELFGKSEEMRTNLKGFQKEKGLAPDGVFGANSASAIAGEISMIDIKKIESSIFHPETPSYMMFILPYDVVKKNPSKFSGGIASLLETGKRGMTVEQFAAKAKPGDKFVIFVYFLDRIDPNIPIKIGFSASDQALSTATSTASYAAPGTWPVIAETFCIDDALETNGLAANVLIKSGFTYKNLGKCILKEKVEAEPE